MIRTMAMLLVAGSLASALAAVIEVFQRWEFSAIDLMVLSYGMVLAAVALEGASKALDR